MGWNRAVSVAGGGPRTSGATAVDGKRVAGTGGRCRGRTADHGGDSVVSGAGRRFPKRGEYSHRWESIAVYAGNFLGDRDTGGIAARGTGIANGPEHNIAGGRAKDDQCGKFVGTKYAGGERNGLGDGAAGRRRTDDQYAAAIAAGESGI